MIIIMFLKKAAIRSARKLIMETHSSLKTRRAGKFGINVLCKESGNDNENNN